jgi:hypothetical protein
MGCEARRAGACSSHSTQTALVRHGEELTMVEVTRLPGGGCGLHLPSGELADVAHLSASALSRMSDADFAAVMEWVTAERERRAKRAAENERAAIEYAASQRAQREFVAARQERWVRGQETSR